MPRLIPNFLKAQEHAKGARRLAQNARYHSNQAAQADKDSGRETAPRLDALRCAHLAELQALKAEQAAELGDDLKAAKAEEVCKRAFYEAQENARFAKAYAERPRGSQA